MVEKSCLAHLLWLHSNIMCWRIQNPRDNHCDEWSSKELAKEAKRVFGDEVNITTEGQRHLGAVIMSQEYRDQYCEEKVRGWKEEIERLSANSEEPAPCGVHCFHKRLQVEVHLLYAHDRIV